MIAYETFWKLKNFTKLEYRILLKDHPKMNIFRDSSVCGVSLQYESTTIKGIAHNKYCYLCDELLMFLYCCSK